MKDCWQVLGLEYGVDKKAIKSAYAKRLKKTRPDENPDGFKALHDAYQSALRIASSEYYQQDMEGTDTETTPKPMWDDENLSFNPDYLATDQTDEKKQPLAAPEREEVSESKETHHQLNGERPEDIRNDTQDAVLSRRLSAETLEQEVIANEVVAQQHAQEEAMYEALQADWDCLFEKVQALIVSPKGGLKVDEWRFIEDVPSMLDLEFKGRAADQMFGIVAETNEISLRAKSLRIQPPVLNYLNAFFDWEGRWQTYAYRFDETMLNAVFPYLSSAQNADAEHSNGPREVHYYKRLMAFLMDAGIVMGVIKFALLILAPMNLAEEYDTGVYIQALAFYFLLIVPVMEASYTEASLGKMVFGLRVISKQGLKLPWYQSFWRSIISLACIAGFKIVVWLNIFFIHKYDALLQDLASRSYVVRSNNNLFTYANAVLAFFRSK